MRNARVTVALLVLAAPAAAHGQSVSDDVRCLLVSNAFAKGAQQEQARRVAGASAAFYLGRLSGRTDAGAIGSAMRTQPAGINQKNAGPVMNACAARMTQAERSLQALARTAAAKK